MESFTLEFPSGSTPAIRIGFIGGVIFLLQKDAHIFVDADKAEKIASAISYFVELIKENENAPANG